MECDMLITNERGIYDIKCLYTVLLFLVFITNSLEPFVINVEKKSDRVLSRISLVLLVDGNVWVREIEITWTHLGLIISEPGKNHIMDIC